MTPTIIECAINGPWTRKRQPGIPIAVNECVEAALSCAAAGASIIHVHPYDAATGIQRDDWEIYARIIEGIHAHLEVPVYPTIPLRETGETGHAPAARYAATEALAARGLLELAAVDPGSVNFTLASGGPGVVDVNEEQDILHGLRLAAEHGFKPAYAIYEPGFLRAGAALRARVPGAPEPLYRFMFSTDFLFGYPPQAYALEAMLTLKAACAPAAPWMISGLGVDITPLITHAVARGGHVRVGLEDAPLGTSVGNVRWVEKAAQAIENAGGSVATPDEMRLLLRLSPEP